MQSSKISLILPYIRPEGMLRCWNAVCANSGEHEVELVTDEDVERIGVPKMVKALVAKSSYDLVMFLADDSIPQPGFLDEALTVMATLPDSWGLVGFNDGHHDGRYMATHWLADKRLLPLLDGEFFHTGYWHCFCDTELTLRCTKLGRYAWAEKAMIEHKHPILEGTPLTGDYARVYSVPWQVHDRRLFLRRNEK